jgi:hypothetical protein
MFRKKGRKTRASGIVEWLARLEKLARKSDRGGRPAARIDPLLAELAEEWKKCPDMRLGQLLLFAAGDSDLFDIEDEQLMKGLRRK